MALTFLNGLLLAGLAALVIPPIVHLLNRKRFEVVPWGAMQFLEPSERTRRRIFLEELLLMLVRMGLIGAMVLALAAPVATSPIFSYLGAAGPRDIVLVIDGSSSMDYRHDGTTAHDAAKEWALAFLDDLSAGDGVAVIQARSQPVPTLGELSTEFDRVRTAIQTLFPPRGGCDAPAALTAACTILADSAKSEKAIVVLTDGQRQGWGDETTMSRWELLAQQHKAAGMPDVWVVNVAADRPADLPNWSVAPIRASRAVAAAGQTVTFRTALARHGTGELPVPRVRLEVDGHPAGDLPVGGATGETGQLPLTVRHRFVAPGAHLVSVIADPDALPGDNRQDFALEVLPALPVLLVDGDRDRDARNRGVDFLRDALAPARDPTPSVLARVISIGELDPDRLTRDLAGPSTSPRVLVLADVPALTRPQADAVQQFLMRGGGVLMTLGARADAAAYNRELFRDGKGWLPAKLEQAVGDLSDPAHGAQPLAASFFHPALELFRDALPGGLSDARFPRRWKLTVPPDTGAAAVARLTGDEPFLVEKSIGAGRVILSTVPLDNTWRTNLIELPAFAPLAHELVYYLAGARGADLNLSAGQPLRYRLPANAPAGPWTLQPPDGPPRTLGPADSVVTDEDTREPGVYRLTGPGGGMRYYAVPQDARESDLAPLTESDQEKLKTLLPTLAFAADRRAISVGLLHPPRDQELWWVCMVLVIALLCVEVWMTRRRALAAG